MIVMDAWFHNIAGFCPPCSYRIQREAELLRAGDEPDHLSDQGHPSGSEDRS